MHRMSFLWFLLILLALVACGNNDKKSVRIQDLKIIKTTEDNRVSFKAFADDMESSLIRDIQKPVHGELVDEGDGVLAYVPKPNYAGTDRLAYVLSTGLAREFELVVEPVNDPPFVFDDIIAARVGESAPLNPLDNDMDIEGDTLTITSMGEPALGDLTATAEGWTFSAKTVGRETIQYVVSDGTTTKSASIHIFVLGPEMLVTGLTIEAPQNPVVDASGQFKAMAQVSNADPMDVTTVVTWRSLDPARLTFDAGRPGWAKFMASGPVEVRANFNSFSEIRGILIGGHVPEKPGYMTAMADSDSVHLNWDLVNGANRYNLYMVKGGATDVIANVLPPYVLTGLTPNTTYRFRISALNDFGESDKSEWANATTLAKKTEIIPNLAATSNPGRIELVWESTAGHAYTLHWSPQPFVDGLKNPQSQSITDASSPLVLSEQLTHDTLYYFKLVVAGDGGIELAADRVSARFTAAHPATPTIDKIDQGDGALTIYFQTDEGLQYDLHWVQGAGDFASGVRIDAVSSPYTHEPLMNGQSYTYYLTATNRHGLTSAPSDAAVQMPVVARGNNPPVARAGPDQTVAKGELVTLDGTASDDVEKSKLTFVWRQISGETVDLDLTDPAKPTFTAPLSAVELVFSLTVNDGQDDSLADTVLIRAGNQTDIDVSASHASGAINSPIVVTLTCNDGAVSVCNRIFYTTDGSDPTLNARLYAGGINVNGSMELRFIAEDTNGNTTDVIARNFVFDTVLPQAEIISLPANFALVPASVLRVAVLATDNDEIAEVLVNGVLATQVAGTDYWVASLDHSGGDFPYGNNVILVDVKDRAGNARNNLSSTTARHGYLMTNSQAMTYDDLNDRLVVVQSDDMLDVKIGREYIGRIAGGLDHVISLYHRPGSNDVYMAGFHQDIVHVDMNSGVYTRITYGYDTAQGPVTSQMVDFVSNGAGTTGYILDKTGIYTLEMSSGKRVLLSEAGNTGQGPAMVNPAALMFDTGETELLLFDDTRIVSVHPETGVRKDIINHDSTFLAVALNRDNGDIYFLDGNHNIQVFDRATPAITLFYTANPSFPTTDFSGFAVDPKNGKVFVSNWITADNFSWLLAIDMVTKVASYPLDQSIGSGEIIPTDLSVPSRGRLDFDPDNNAVYFGSYKAKSVIRLNLADGSRETVADAVTGTGVTLDTVEDVDYDEVSKLLYVTDSSQLFSINSDRLRVAVSTTASPVGETIDRYFALTVAGGMDKAYVVGTADRNVIFEIDLNTKAAKTIASATVGTGEAMVAVTDVYFDTPHKQLYYLTDSALIKLNLTTLAREQAVNGLRLVRADSVIVDGARDTAYVMEAFDDKIYHIDLTAGTYVVTDIPEPSYIFSLAYDSVKRNLFFVDGFKRILWSYNIPADQPVIIGK